MMAALLQERPYEAAVEEVVRFPFVNENSAPLSSHPGWATAEFRFGRWCLVPAARLLLHDGKAVDLGSRAFDLLHLLLSKRGLIVEKDTILSFVWPSTIVEESNLRFQMAALRKTLGLDGAFIKTIPGRGYIFAAEYRFG